MKVSLLAMLAVLSSGCVASAHTGIPGVTASATFVAPQPQVTVTVPVPAIQFHYIWTSGVWIRNPGPPPRGTVYHAHPRHRHTVIVRTAGHAHRPPPRSTNHRHTNTRRRSTR